MLIVHAAWDAAGRPDPNWQGKARTPRKPPDPRDGWCCHCGAAGSVYPHRHVVSDLFTGWDRLRRRDLDPAGAAFCQACAWAFRLRVAMQRPHALVDGRFGEVDPATLHRALAQLHRHPSWCVLVPVSRQKHLLPFARHGTVRTDDETLTWAGGDVDRLDTYARLRQAGFGETALVETEPRWPILAKLDPDAKRWTLARWHDLDPWRAHPAYMDVAARATRQNKEA